VKDLNLRRQSRGIYSLGHGESRWFTVSLDILFKRKKLEIILGDVYLNPFALSAS
jgi:hypothetical protein